MVLGVILLLIIVLSIGILVYTSVTSKRLVCTSSNGNITIMYKKNRISGYVAKGIIYNLEEQNEYAKQVGIDTYLAEFTKLFETKFNGICK